MTNLKKTSAAEKIKSKFSELISHWDDTNPKKIYFDIPPAHIHRLVSYLFNDLNLRFIIASGTDTRRAVEILYHFADDNTGAVLSARATLKDKKDLRIDSISDLFIGASWIEREIHELLGVDFPGNSNLKHLLLNDDWPKNDFPLRHDND
jgi:NADH:ubiquinone oxidoreductase subunit C